MNKLLFNLSSKDFIGFIVVFTTIVVTAKFGQYLYFEWETSPAVLWPPTGIAVAIVWLFGYRYIVPVFLGLFAASITGPTAHLIPSVLTTPLAQASGHFVIVYLLKRFGFEGSFKTIRDILVFLASIMLGCVLAPTITTLISSLLGNLTALSYISWSRSWAGYVFSCLILSPLIISWAHIQFTELADRKKELFFVTLLLIVSVYLLFWTKPPLEVLFFIFSLFFVTHLWVCVRFSIPILTLTLFATTTLGLLGLFLYPDQNQPLNQQLLTTELFLFLIVPIFYVFSALVKERASIIKDLRSAINRNEKESIAKNNFIAILAHELRNPLAPIRTTLEILMLQEHEAQTQRLLHSADRQAFAMQRLLDDLLDITRVTQGKFKLQLRNENVCEMLQRCMDTTSELMKLYDHTVVMSPKCDPTVFLHVDTVRFEQVIVNLLSNSAKYTPPSGRILISMDVHEESVAIKVTDNGIGIVEANIKEVFEPFWQLESETAPTRGGIGVGLSLTKHIVELHGGTIMAESEGLGKGSTFTVRMPRSEIDRNDAHSVLLQKTKNIPTLRILIADDNGAASDSLAKLLSLKGHVTRAVYSGNEVLTSIDTFIPDILLLDIGLPDMSGFEVAKRLREQGLTIKIVALSGYGQQEDKKRAAEAGFDDHFTKPMPIKRFEEYLSKL